MNQFRILTYLFIASLPFDHSYYKLFGILTPPEIIGILMFFSTLFLWHKKKNIKVHLSKYSLPIKIFFCFSIFISVSIFLSQGNSNVIGLLHIWSEFFIFLSLISLINSQAEVHKIEKIFFAVGLTIAFLNILQCYSFFSFEIGGISYTRLPFLEMRVSSINPIFAISGTYLLISLIISMNCVIVIRNYLRKAFYALASLIIMFGIYINQSRSVIIALFLSAVVFFIFKFTRKRLLSFICLLFTFLVLSWPQTDIAVFDINSLYVDLVSIEERTVNSRVDQYGYVKEIMAIGYNSGLLFGGGPDVYQLDSPDDRDLHNTFMFTLLSYGIIGFLLLVSLLLLTIKSLVKNSRNTHDSQLSIIFLSILVGMILMMNGYNAFSSYLLPVMIAISLVAANIKSIQPRMSYQSKNQEIINTAGA